MAAALLDSTANPDGPGILLRGREHQPASPDQFDPVIVEALLRLARLSERVGAELLDHPDSRVRRSAAVLAARAHPLLVGLVADG